MTTIQQMQPIGIERGIYEEGDLVSDRVIVLSREVIITGIDTKHLESEVVLKLDEMLLKAERKVIGKKL